jgi:hypothetical protein
MEHFNSEHQNDRVAYSLPMVVIDFYNIVDQISDLQNQLNDNESDDQLDLEIAEKALEEQLLQEQEELK